MNYTDFITKSLTDTAKIANEQFGKVGSTVKKDDYNQVLTETDKAIGALLIKRINSAFPDYNIIDEEAGVIDHGSRFTWVNDPIDGTSNFAAGTPLYGTMIGLLEGSTPIAAGICLPFFNEIYTAERGKGAYFQGKRLSVTPEKDLVNVLVSYGVDGHRDNPDITKKESSLLANIILKCRNVRMSNSVFDIIMVAKGAYGAWITQTSKIWDNIAPHLIIEEAGGKYTDFFGNQMDYSNPLRRNGQNYTLCSASPAIHKQLQQLIHGHH